MRKTLQDCKTSAEIRQHYPELSKIVDLLEQELQSVSDPVKVLSAAAFVIRIRQRERAATK